MKVRLCNTYLNFPQGLRLGYHLEHALSVARRHTRERDHLQIEVLLQPQLVHHPFGGRTLFVHIVHNFTLYWLVVW